jgi:hypothetical protein
LLIGILTLPGGATRVLPNSAAAATISAQRIAHHFSPVSPVDRQFFQQELQKRAFRGEPNAQAVLRHYYNHRTDSQAVEF